MPFDAPGTSTHVCLGERDEGLSNIEKTDTVIVAALWRGKIIKYPFNLEGKRILLPAHRHEVFNMRMRLNGCNSCVKTSQHRL